MKVYPAQPHHTVTMATSSGEVLVTEDGLDVDFDPTSAIANGILTLEAPKRADKKAQTPSVPAAPNTTPEG